MHEVGQCAITDQLLRAIEVVGDSAQAFGDMGVRRRIERLQVALGEFWSHCANFIAPRLLVDACTHRRPMSVTARCT